MTLCNHYRAALLYTDTIRIEDLPVEQQPSVYPCKGGDIARGAEWTPCKKGLARNSNSTPEYGYGAKAGIGYGRWYLETRENAPYADGK